MKRLCVLIVLCIPNSVLAAQTSTDPMAKHWSPYVCGTLIGILAAATVLISDKPLGISTAYARISGMLGLILAPGLTKRLEYFKDKKPIIEWEVMLFVGVIIGSFLAAWSGGTIHAQLLPDTRLQRFGADSAALRIITAVIGGGFLALGARIAGGCTSGHGISGTMQMSVGSWIALICFFIGGMAVAIPLFGR
jgi:uncharacterized membrane protein YedE/YeeE